LLDSLLEEHSLKVECQTTEKPVLASHQLYREGELHMLVQRAS